MVESNGPKVSELDALGSCFSWGTCLFCPFRTVTTKCFIEAEENVTKGQDLTTAFRTRFGVANGKCPLESANGWQRQPLDALPKRKNYEIYMYNLKYTLSDFHLNLTGKKPRKQHLFLGQRTFS